MIRYIRALCAVLALLGVAACGGNHMSAVEQPSTVASPAPDMPTIVFYRSSLFGAAIAASVFEVTDGELKFVGIFDYGTKLAYQTTPGNHRFMVVSEAADFMDADLAPGRTYYTLVAPRIGMWKARFSLRPRIAGDPEVVEQIASCKWVENNAASEKWARDHMSDAEAKERTYLQEWLGGDKPTLHPSDGA